MKQSIIAIIFVWGTILIASCVKIPNEGSIAPDINYKNRKQYAISGMGQNIGEFLSTTSTLPLHFEIAGIREAHGGDVSAFDEQIPVIHYLKPIVGNESAEELALKTDTVSMPAVTANQHTGQIEVLEGNNIPAGEYHFDIKITNSSGSKLLKDALIIEFIEFEVSSWSSGMARPPEIERVAETPHQIRFVGYLNDVPLHGNQIDFTLNRALGFEGTFVDDTDHGEIWNVGFPVKDSNTYCTWKVVENVGGEEVVSYESEDFSFVLGRAGSYVIRLYK